jgi:hypothetical protein
MMRETALLSMHDARMAALEPRRARWGEHCAVRCAQRASQFVEVARRVSFAPSERIFNDSVIKRCCRAATLAVAR